MEPTQPQLSRQERRQQLRAMGKNHLIRVHRAGAGCLMGPAELKRWTHEELENAILEGEYGPTEGQQ